MANPSQSGPVISMVVVGGVSLTLGMVGGSPVLVSIGGLVLIVAVFWLWQAMRKHHAIHRLERHALEEQAAEQTKLAG